MLFGFLWNRGMFQGPVVYRLRKESGDFAIGLELSGQVQSRMRNLILRGLTCTPISAS